MVEKRIYLEPEQSKAIKQLADQSGVSEAEIIRSALRQHLSRLNRGRLDLDLWKEELAYIQRLMDQDRFEQSPRSWHRDDLYDR